MQGRWFAPCQGQGIEAHHGEPVVAHVCAFNDGVGIGIGEFGGCANLASIKLAGRQAKGFMAALEKAMKKAGLAEGD